ncbi:hypothetical protein [Burkholderia sp. YIM B11467]
MKNVDSDFNKIRKILNVDATAVGHATSAVALTLPSNKDVATWLSALRGSDLHIPWSAEELHLYGSEATLEGGQIGYRVDQAGRRLPNWQDDWVVLGEISGDPIIGRVEESSCAVLFARHGAGTWKANLVSDNTAVFAKVLRVWCDLFIGQYSKNIRDNMLAVRPDFLADLRQHINQTLSDAGAEVFMAMVDG